MKRNNPSDHMEPWRTSIVDAGPAHIRVRGHDVLDLMSRATFTDMIFLLHHNRLPSADERRLLDAIIDVAPGLAFSRTRVITLPGGTFAWR